MEKYGFIGYGSMASMLIEGFLKSKALMPQQILISTRTKSRTQGLKEKWQVTIVEDNIELIQNCKNIFICVKPLEVKGVLDEIAPYLNSSSCLISIAACVTLDDIGTVFKGQVTKIIPSFISEVNEGITLVCHNDKVEGQNRSDIEKLLGSISLVKEIKETDFEIAADLTSCAVGFIASIFQEFVEAGVRQSSLTTKEAEEMVRSTLYGTAKLLYRKGVSFNETIDRVATRGGITEEGVKILRKGLPFVFDTVLEKTLSKHDKVKSMVRNQFSREQV
ncbi:MAG: pyrroline-5-carboxylate reductase dimerization domain-containing protein [Bacillota bacterium]